MATPKYGVRTVVERFVDLKQKAEAFATAQYAHVKRSAELDLHDAALAYVAAVRRVARAGRDT